ncbi:MAG TPA: glycosyl hydrolase family 18 protein [Desulfosporosinus sp.]|nr:glycosyl hydrolase family 18 protein [Desulfosporosinus sp.]
MTLQVFAFYNGLTEEAKGYPSLKRNGNSINQLAVFEIPIQNNGALVAKPSRQLIKDAHAMGIKVILVVSNLSEKGTFSTSLMEHLVRDQEFANLVWQNIKTVLVEYQFDGVNLDLEKAAPADRLLFSKLIKDWSARFKRANFLVSMDVPAKTSTDPLDVWKGAFDYKVIGQAVDEIIIMTYEEHWAVSEPGSVASIPWVTQVLNYALTNIPARKIYMGIPMYGYDWPENGEGKGRVIGYQRAIELAQRYGAPLLWDAKQHSTYFRYETMGVRHIVYFEDPRSLRDKLDLAVKKGIRGVALWEMNLSYPGLWEVLQSYVMRG